MGDIGEVRRHYEVLSERRDTATALASDRIPDPDPMPIPQPEPLPVPDPIPKPGPPPQPPSVLSR
jgi:hypothetical protein